MALRMKKVKYNLFPKNILFSIRTSRDVIKEISRFKGHANSELYIDLIPKIVGTRKEAEKIICGLPHITSYSDFYKCEYMLAVDLERELFWQAAIIRLYKKEINDFLISRQNYYKLLFANKADMALSELENIISIHGLNTWAIENKIALLGMTEGPDGIKKFSNSILENKDLHQFFKTMVEKISDRALPTVSWKFYDKIIDTLTKEVKDANEEGLWYFISYKLNFYQFTIGSVTEILVHESQCPIVDRYLALIRCLQMLEALPSSREIKKTIARVVAYMAQGVEDQALHLFPSCIVTERVVNAQILKNYDYYTSGDYVQCYEGCVTLLRESPIVSEVYEITVRSAFRLNKTCINVITGSLLDDILNLMLQLLLQAEGAQQAFNKLMKLVYIHSNNPSIASVFYYCCKEFRSLSRDEYRKVKRFSELNSTFLTPRVVALREVASGGVPQMKEYSLSVEFLKEIYQKNAEDVLPLNIPSYRKSKYLARIYEANNQLDLAVNIYTDLETSADRLTATEAVISKLVLLLRMKKTEEALSHLVHNYFEKEISPTKLPLKHLFYMLDAEQAPSKKMDLLIAYDLYGKFIDTDRFSKMQDAFDDFIFENNFGKPSDVMNDLSFDFKYKFYFLKNICIPDVMDVCDCFESNKDVLEERVKICLQLRDLDPENYSVYTNEVEEILTSLIVAKVSSKLGTGRIFIDMSGITKAKKDEIETQFLSFVKLTSQVDSEAKLIQYDETGNSFIPGGKKDQLLISIFEEVTNELVHNRDYGLDGNLSLEIRHGQLETLFWVPLERINLVTKKDENAKYQKNLYWWRSYEILQNRYRNEIDAALRNFSKGIDETIEILKREWFVAKPRSGNFGFSLTFEDFALLKSRVEGIDEYDTFWMTILEIAKEITEENLKILREKVNAEVPLLFEKNFETLYEELLKIRSNFAVTELEATIALGRTEVHKAVEELSTLLELANKHDFPDFEVLLPLNLSIDAFKTTFSHKNINFDCSVDQTPIIMGKFLHDFVRIFLTIFDNIVRHSGLDEIVIWIAICNQDDHLMVTCRNMVNTSKDIAQIRKVLDEIRKKINDKSYSDSVNREGKSGLYKIDKILSVNMGCQHQIDFKVENDFSFTFYLSINTARIVL